MSHIILSINAGSSSIKVSVFSATSEKQPSQLADIQISGLTAPPAKLKYTRGEEKVSDKEIEKVSDVKDAFKVVLDELINDQKLDQLNNVDDVDFACHRIVHGGGYDKPIRIDKDTLHHLESLSDLAPLHNAGALEIVKAVHDRIPQCTNVAFFDSMFHQTISEPVRTYMIDRKKAKENGLRKYGFHGLSYAFIIRAVAEHLKKEIEKTSIIALHLGSGASACAIKDGKSVDTTMGLTPLSGLPGATRSGDVDPSLVFHLTSDAGKLSPSSTKDLHITQAEVTLNKDSGWKALSGTTDFGAVSSKAEDGDVDCKLAFDVFVDRLISFIGSYYVKLGGKVDALVFAGGIGEKGSQLRKAVAEAVKCLGFELDDKANDGPGDEVVFDVSAKDAKHKILICQTDEQTEMARECVSEAKRLRS